MRVVVSESARDDLRLIGAWIAKDNLKAARLVLEHILHCVDQLESLPHLGHKGRARGTLERCISRTPYIIVYKIQKLPEAVIVVAVLHGSRNR